MNRPPIPTRPARQPAGGSPWWRVLLLAIFLPRAYLALSDQGIIWSDEIFQTLEQGHRVAFGYGLVPWEFRDGARSWLLPGLLAGAMKVLAGVGMTNGASLVGTVKLLFAFLSTAAFYPVLRMADAWGGRRAAVLLGLCAIALPAHLIYGSRAMAEVASAPVLTWGLWLLWSWGIGPATRSTSYDGSAASWWEKMQRPALAGSLLGLAALLRYQNGVLLPAVVLIVAARRSVRAAAFVAGAAAFVLLLGGALDWLTWGKPFQSLIVYLRFNLVENGANQWGVAAKDFFVRAMWSTNGPALLFVGLGFLAGLRRTWPVALLASLFFVLHSAVPHKELRFLFPSLPLFLLCGAVGLAALIAKLPFPRSQRRLVGRGLAMGLLVLFALRSRYVSFADIGQPMSREEQGGPTSSLVWGAFGERNQLLNQAGIRADICGLVAPTMNAYWTGGYSYLHRRVPLLWTGAPADFAAANYALVGVGQKLTDTRYRRVAQVGQYSLFRRDGACTPAPHGSDTFGRLTPAGVSSR